MPVTPAATFAAMLPGLVLIATLLHDWSSRVPVVAGLAGGTAAGTAAGRGLPPMFVPLSIYGGFYSGNSFLVLPCLPMRACRRAPRRTRRTC